MLTFNNRTSYYSLARNALLIMAPLLLQKPSKTSKTKDHIQYLEKRLALWKNGDFRDILREGKKIQERLLPHKKKIDPDHARKVFSRLMLQGKVSPAMKWLDVQTSTGSLEINHEVIETLKEKTSTSPKI